MADPYGLDPAILQSMDISRERSPGDDNVIGLGQPIFFPFQANVSLSDTWTIVQGQGGDPAVQGNDGFLRFSTSPTPKSVADEYATATITRPFASSQSTITLAFQMRMNSAPDATLMRFSLYSDKDASIGLMSNAGQSGFFYYTHQDSHDTSMAQSAIAADGKWHQIIIVLSPSKITLWEDDRQMFSWSPEAPVINPVQLGFFLEKFVPVAMSIDVGNVTVLPGLARQARLSRGLRDTAQQQLAGQIPQLSTLPALGPDVAAAAADVAKALRSISVGPGALFWGVSMPPDLSAKAATLQASAPVQRLITAARSAAPGLGHGPTTFYIGVSISASFVISGSLALGIYIGPNHEQFVGVTPAIGGTTNAGVQAGIGLAVMAGPPNSFTGLGCYIQVDIGEAAQAALGVTGNIPLHLENWDNCGPHLTLAAGIGALPVDVGGGFSYTFNVGNL